MDAELTQLMAAFPLDEHRAREWHAALRTAHENEPADFDAFLTRLRDESAHIVDPQDIERFVEELDRIGGDRMDLIRRLVEHDPDELTPDRFAWVPPESVERLSSAWGPDWQTPLGEQLDYRWGEGWEQHSNDDKAAWLHDLLAELLGSEEPAGPAEPADPATRFDWVPTEIAERLSSAWGPDWQTPLGEQLDYRWGDGWEQHPADPKAAWLPDVVDELLAPADDIPAQPGAPTPEPDGAAGFSADQIKSAVDDVLAEVPGAEDLSEEELRQIRAAVAAALAEEGVPAQ